MWDRPENDPWENPPDGPGPACETCLDTYKVTHAECGAEECPDCDKGTSVCHACPTCPYCGDKLSMGNHLQCWKIDDM